MKPETICTRCVSLLGLPGVTILDVEDVPGAPLRVHIEVIKRPVGCESCGVVAHVKDRPVVELVDVSIGRRAMRLVWHKRRFRCPEPSCEVRTWTEDDPRIAPRGHSTSDRVGRWVTEQVGRNARSVKPRGEPMPFARDVDTVVHYIRSTLGPQSSWTPFGGYPGDIEAALVDSVFSTRYKYTTTYGRGLRPKMNTWLLARTRVVGPSASDLVAEISGGGGPQSWAGLHFTHHTISGRPKSEIVLQAAELLAHVGFDDASAIGSGDLIFVLDLLQAIRGIGLPTARYFAMLLGFPEVKPDVMVKGFLREALGRNVSDLEAIALVKVAGTKLSVPDVRNLDHAIWSTSAVRVLPLRWWHPDLLLDLTSEGPG